jgi:hypothetical protein
MRFIVSPPVMWPAPGSAPAKLFAWVLLSGLLKPTAMLNLLPFLGHLPQLSF